MTTQTKTLRELNSEALLVFVQELKNNNFDIYMPEGVNSTYCFFVKGNNIGYVESGTWGFNFSTVHKPCRHAGTGYSIVRDCVNPSVQLAEDCFINRPGWASKDEPVTKWYSWEERVKKETVIKYVKY